IMAVIGTASYTMMATENRVSVINYEAVQARYLTEAGIEYAIKVVASGGTLSASETVSIANGSVGLSATLSAGSALIGAVGHVNSSQKRTQVNILYRPPISDSAIYATGDITNVDALDEGGNPDPDLIIDNAPTLPPIETQAMIDTATAQGHVEPGPFIPSHGYPNFNFYYSGTIPNITYVQGDMEVQGGRTIYGIFVVEGNVRLNGASRVEGVLYMVTPNTVVLYGGGSPTESSVTGGIIANGDVDGSGNHITVHYKSEYMESFGVFEDRTNPIMKIVWREP
ncbi:MAG: hypothetical protein O7G31_12360, partial [Calditrichaeota bacterium]|nr:hypothetical protein [Calditrichota bacterium]